MSSYAVRTLDGGSNADSVARVISTSASRGSTISIPVLASNSYFVCWVNGGSHQPSGSLAVVTFALVILVLPTALLLWIRRDPHLRAELARQSPATASASRCVIVRPHDASVLLGGKTPAALAPTPSVLLLPILSDYRPDAW